MEYAICREGNEDYLEHFGVKGQKWGIRRYENEDGTLTDAGKIRYAKSVKDAKKYKTAKERLKTVGKAGLAGAAVGYGLLAGPAVRDFIKAKRTGISGGTPMTSDLAGQAASVLIAAPAIGGMTISAIQQGYQAAKVKRGQKFVEKYKSAYEKTYGRQP